MHSYYATIPRKTMNFNIVNLRVRLTNLKAKLTRKGVNKFETEQAIKRTKESLRKFEARS